MPSSILSRYRPILAIGGILVSAAVVVVGLTLQRPEPPTYAPSPVEPRPVGEERVGPLVRTVDATVPEQWVPFSFRDGSVIHDPGPLEWDLAFRRFGIIVNGGDGFAGHGGIIDLGEVPFDSVRILPEEGYVQTQARGDSVNAAIERWYSYSIFSHLLHPLPKVYAIRTADRRYAKMRILGYYCAGATPGCVTVQYVFQGDGTREVGAPSRIAIKEARSGNPEEAGEGAARSGNPEETR